MSKVIVIPVIAFACLSCSGPAASQATGVDLNTKGGFVFNAVGQKFSAKIRLSEPGGGWVDSSQGAHSASGNSVTWDTSEVEVTRTVTGTPTHLDVSDKFSNRTSHLIGVIVQDIVSTGSSPQATYVDGAEVTVPHQTYNRGNPSVYSGYFSGGLGIVEDNDLFEAQGKLGVFADGMHLTDDSLGMDSGGTVTLEWSIYPTPSNNYWDFVNTVRNDWNLSYTINGPFSYEPGGWQSTEKASPQSASLYGNWASQRGLYYLSNVSTNFDNGDIADGTAVPLALKGFAATTAWMAKAKQATPTVNPLIYFHDQICTEPNADSKYSDAKAYDSTGAEITYPYAKQRMPLFIPTANDSYGRALVGTLQQLLGTPGVGGIYWDEMSIALPEQTKSGYAYGNIWDQVSVDINGTTHEVTKKKICAPLAMQGFEEEGVKTIRDAGKELVANTEPYTRTMRDLHVTRFVEGKSDDDGTIQLGCPIVLSNMRVDTTLPMAMQDATSILNQGGIFFAWHELWTPAQTDFYKLMFPITPVDIRPGVVTGAERILASKSGTYGFTDGSQAKVYIFDGTGNVRNDISVNSSSAGSNTMYQVSVPDGGMAILVKQ